MVLTKTIQSIVNDALKATTFVGSNVSDIGGIPISWNDIPIRIRDNLMPDNDEIKEIVDIFSDTRDAKGILENTEKEIRKRVDMIIDMQRKLLSKSEKDDIVLMSKRYRLLTQQKKRKTFDNKVVDVALQNITNVENKFTEIIANGIISNHKTECVQGASTVNIIDALSQALANNANLQLGTVQVQSALLVEAVKVLKSQSSILKNGYGETPYQTLFIQTI